MGRKVPPANEATPRFASVTVEQLLKTPIAVVPCSPTGIQAKGLLLASIRALYPDIFMGQDFPTSPRPTILSFHCCGPADG
jgi:hypothetical protein